MGSRCAYAIKGYKSHRFLKVLVEPIAASNRRFVKGLLQNKSGALGPIVGSARADSLQRGVS